MLIGITLFQKNMNMYPSLNPNILEAKILPIIPVGALQVSFSLHSMTRKVRESVIDFLRANESWNPKTQNSISTSGAIVGLVLIAGVVRGTRQTQVPGQGLGKQKPQSKVHGLHKPPSQQSKCLRQGPFGTQSGGGHGIGVVGANGFGVVVNANVLWISEPIKHNVEKMKFIIATTIKKL